MEQMVIFKAHNLYAESPALVPVFVFVGMSFICNIVNHFEWWIETSVWVAAAAAAAAA